METFEFEKEIIDSVFAHTLYIEDILPKASDDLKTLFVYLKILIDKDKNYDVVNDTNTFFSLLGLCIFGRITYSSEEFNFLSLIKEDENKIVTMMYLVTMSLMISFEFIEMKNIYKCIKNQYENATYIYNEISSIISEGKSVDHEIKIDKKIVDSICRKIPTIIDLLYSDFDLRKQ